MTKPQLHFNINIPVTFSAPYKEEMSPERKRKVEKRENCLTKYCLCCSLDL